MMDLLRYRSWVLGCVVVDAFRISEVHFQVQGVKSIACWNVVLNVDKEAVTVLLVHGVH